MGEETDIADGDTAIHRLDPTTVERIAAGEVVERPASAVKELVENGLDADADRIEVAVDGDGTDRIRVRDDGVGMTEADVRAAVQEHTTSKIDGIEDLESGVATLGFRGEALHTIGAVSRTTITTKPRGGPQGTRLRYEGGEVTSVEPAGCPEGTTVEVEDLFYNTPARRKYLKREATEFAHVNRVVSRYALANPDVAVSLEHDGRETFSTAGQGAVRSAILSVYGREVAEAMIPVAAGDPPDVATDLPGEADEELPEGPLDGIAGYVSHPETTRSNADYVSTFVNGRYVTAGTVRDAAIEAYGGQLAADRYPFTVLYLDLPADAVDVNVHPRKMEVRFDDDEGVRRQVRAAVRSALLDHGLERSSAPRGRSAPEETPVGSDVSGSSEDSDVAGTVADRTDDDHARGGEGQSGRPANAGEERSTTGPTVSEGADPGDSAGPNAGGTADREDPRQTAGTHSEDLPVSGDEGTPPRPDDTEGGPRDGSRDRVGKPDASGDPSSGSSPPTGRKFDSPTEQRTLDGDQAAPSESYERLPRMRVLGQYDDTYLVAETPSGLVLVDQHAADERINYERLREAFEGSTTAQRLAGPVTVTLTAGEAATFSAAADALSNLGFEAELVDGPDSDADADDAAGTGRRLRVTAVPAVFDETLDPDELRAVLSSFVDGDPADTVDALADRFLADLACYPSITGNTSLTEGSVTGLLAALDECENPYACPHGRPVIVEFDHTEIEDRFERDYPGHGH